MGEIKQQNFRINEERAEAFRAFCVENGLSQAQGFDHLMQVLEIDQAKKVAPAREKDIETFEMHVKNIMKDYMESIRMAEETEVRVYENFRSDLEKKEDYIDKLKSENQAKEELLATGQERVITAENELQQALKDLETAKEKALAAEQIAKDKSTIIGGLEKNFKAAEEKLSDYYEMSKRYDALVDGHEKQRQEIFDLKQEKENALKEMQYQMENALKEAEIEKINEVNLVKEEYRTLEKKLVQLKADKDAEISKIKMETQEQISSIKDEKNALILEKQSLLTELQKLQAEIKIGKNITENGDN